MENEPQDVSGRFPGVDQVNIACTEVKPEVANQADISYPPAAPEKQSVSSPVPHNPRVSKSNEFVVTRHPDVPRLLKENLASPAAVRPQDTATMSQSAQDIPELPRTPDLLARPRRYGPGTGYEVRMPANMTPARIYRSSFGPDTSQIHNAATALPGPRSRILPIGELITSHGNRTYTLWANEQQRTTNRISTQVMITNVNSTTTFKSYSGVSRRSPLEVLDDFSSLLRAQGIALMSLNVVLDSFVAVISTDKGWEELREGILRATR